MSKSSQTNKGQLNDLFAELKHEYIDSFDEKILSIQTYLEKGDLRNLENEFHKIKGTGSTYGVHEASEIADLLEELCQKNSPQLGLSVLMAIELFHKICFAHKQNKSLDLSTEKHMHSLNQFLLGKKSA
jgi:HPt (histidine-containing phosphotransfer) domain-containing protein